MLIRDDFFCRSLYDFQFILRQSGHPLSYYYANL
jgi:hypothetical protein